MTETTLAVGFRSRLMGLLRAFRTWTLSRIVVALSLIAIASALSQALIVFVLPGAGLMAVLFSVACIHLAYAFYVRGMEQRRLTELELDQAPRGLAIGFAAGTMLMLGTMSILAAAGTYRIGTYQGFEGFAGAVSVSVFSAYAEELVFRGVLFRLVEAVVGSWWSLGVSAVLFGVMHLANPGAGIWSTAAISVEAGILLGAAYVLTRTLWIPIGVHLGWNLVQGGVLGLNVSGKDAAGLFDPNVEGPAWLTGGHFGPEASIAAVILCLSAAVAMLVLASRRHLIMRPRWRRGRSQYS